MKTFTLTTAAAAALTAGILGLAAPAAAAPSGDSASDTISQLEAQGARVVVQREGNASLDDAQVVSIQRGPDVRQSIPFATSNGDHSRSVSGQTVYVTVR